MSKAITLEDIKDFGFATEDFVVEALENAKANMPDNSLKTAEPFVLESGLPAPREFAWHFKDVGDKMPWIYICASYTTEEDGTLTIPADYYVVNHGTGTLYVKVLRPAEVPVETTTCDVTYYIYSDCQPYYGSGM